MKAGVQIKIITYFSARSSWLFIPFSSYSEECQDLMFCTFQEKKPSNCHQPHNYTSLYPVVRSFKKKKRHSLKSLFVGPSCVIHGQTGIRSDVYYSQSGCWRWYFCSCGWTAGSPVRRTRTSLRHTPSGGSQMFQHGRFSHFPSGHRQRSHSS